MAWATAIMLAMAATSAGLQASGTIKPPSMPAPRARTGGGKSGVPYSPVRKGTGGIPYQNSGGGPGPSGGPMIPNMPNTLTPDVLGALGGTPASSMGGPIGMLSSGGSGGGLRGMPYQGNFPGMPAQGGALSSGGMSPQMLQAILGGMNAGQSIMQGAPIAPTLTGAAMGAIPAMAGGRPPMPGAMPGAPPMPGQAMAGGPGMPGGVPDIPPPQGADPQDWAQFLEMMKAKGMGGAGGPMGGMT